MTDIPDRRFYECHNCGHEWAHIPMSMPPHCPNCESVMTGHNKHDIRNLDDACWPTVSFGNGPGADGQPREPLMITDEQAAALFRKWKQASNDMSWREFAASIHPTFGMDDAITVQWSGMFLCIEKDGYCHT